MFLAEIEQGMEVYIPDDLRVDKYPKSYRYYDFILRLIQETISVEKQEFFGIQKAIAIAFMKREKQKSLYYRLTNRE